MHFFLLLGAGDLVALTADRRCSLALSTLTPTDGLLEKGRTLGTVFQKLVSPFNRDHGSPPGLLGPLRGAWVRGPGAPREAWLQPFSAGGRFRQNHAQPQRLGTKASQGFRLLPSLRGCLTTLFLLYNRTEHTNFFFLQYFILPN